MKGRLTTKDFGLVVLSAVLMLMSLPKLDIGILAWVCFIPWLLALEGKTPKEAFILSYVAGLVIFAGMTYWIWTVRTFRLIDFVLLAIYFPHYASLWGLGVTWLRRRTGLSPVVIAPAFWVALEYIRSHFFFLSAPWMLLGHSQYLHPLLTQVASLTGVYGLSFVIVVVNVALWEAFHYGRQRFRLPAHLAPSPQSALASAGVAGALLIGANVYGASVLERPPSSDSMTVALIQANIPKDVQWNAAYRQQVLRQHAKLTRQAAQHGPQLIVWPESAVPGDVQHDPDLHRIVSELAVQVQAYLLVGSSEKGKFVSQELNGKSYNSMFLFSPEGTIIGQYRKIARVPFAEYEPLEGVIKWPKWIVSAMGHTVPGEDFTIFTVEGTHFGSVICWENIFPELFREFVKRGARFMVSATNESWFGDTAAPYQLLAMSVFRAAENRVAIARSTNTGITAFIDPFGRITERLRGPEQQELFVDGLLLGSVPLSEGLTFYTRYGDVFAFLQISLCVLMLVFACTRHSVPAETRDFYIEPYRM